MQWRAKNGTAGAGPRASNFVRASKRGLMFIQANSGSKGSIVSGHMSAKNTRPRFPPAVDCPNLPSSLMISFQRAVSNGHGHQQCFTHTTDWMAMHWQRRMNFHGQTIPQWKYVICHVQIWSISIKKKNTNRYYWSVPMWVLFLQIIDQSKVLKMALQRCLYFGGGGGSWKRLFWRWNLSPRVAPLCYKQQLIIRMYYKLFHHVRNIFVRTKQLFALSKYPNEWYY